MWKKLYFSIKCRFSFIWLYYRPVLKQYDDFLGTDLNFEPRSDDEDYTSAVISSPNVRSTPGPKIDLTYTAEPSGEESQTLPLGNHGSNQGMFYLRL
ncbi:hypothetical protein AVEN_86632-1 [Araneus ventricosus]|uniref:Uncharacterized protein n=1 Tax=Araneus ventricosus TaxID=182803 RepID=A0A4Y2HVK5_ARAVE|nr:hypothetical protein AVEN_86632-1 [Araneus ventricosus]